MPAIAFAVNRRSPPSLTLVAHSDADGNHPHTNGSIHGDRLRERLDERRAFRYQPRRGGVGRFSLVEEEGPVGKERSGAPSPRSHLLALRLHSLCLQQARRLEELRSLRGVQVPLPTWPISDGVGLGLWFRVELIGAGFLGVAGTCWRSPSSRSCTRFFRCRSRRTVSARALIWCPKIIRESSISPEIRLVVLFLFDRTSHLWFGIRNSFFLILENPS